MQLFSIEDLTPLTHNTDSPCLSLYMPTERRGTETQQNPIRFKNLMRSAEEQIIASGMRPQAARELLEGAHKLDTYEFWQHQEDGLALFLSPSLLHYHCLPIALPELAIVTERFHLKPLLQLLSGDGQFYILALSQNQVRLFQGTRFSVSEIELEDMPTSLAEALRFDDPEKSLQFHTGTAQGSGDRAAVFHGHGAGNDDQKDNLLRYFRKVDSGLQAFLSSRSAPLVLAGVDYLLPIYQQANSYQNLINEGVIGNPEHLTPEELHEQAWQKVQPYFEQVRQTSIDRFHELTGTGQTTSQIEAVVPAAHFQRVETLFVPVGQQVWGSFDASANRVQIHPQAEVGDEDLLDHAAVHTLLNGGTVFAVEPDQVPGESPLAAIFRY